MSTVRQRPPPAEQSKPMLRIGLDWRAPCSVVPTVSGLRLVAPCAAPLLKTLHRAPNATISCTRDLGEHELTEHASYNPQPRSCTMPNKATTSDVLPIQHAHTANTYTLAVGAACTQVDAVTHVLACNVCQSIARPSRAACRDTLRLCTCVLACGRPRVFCMHGRVWLQVRFKTSYHL